MSSLLGAIIHGRSNPCIIFMCAMLRIHIALSDFAMLKRVPFCLPTILIGENSQPTPYDLHNIRGKCTQPPYLQCYIDRISFFLFWFQKATCILRLAMNHIWWEKKMLSLKIRMGERNNYWWCSNLNKIIPT